MHEHKPILGSEAHLERERTPPLLCDDTGVAELLHMLHTRYALYHLLNAELLVGPQSEDARSTHATTMYHCRDEQ